MYGYMHQPDGSSYMYSNYPAKGTRYEIENARRAAGYSRVLYMKVVPSGLFSYIFLTVTN